MSPNHEGHACPISPRRPSDIRFPGSVRKLKCYPSNHSPEFARRSSCRETAPYRIRTHRGFRSGWRAVFGRNRHSPVHVFSAGVTAEKRVTGLLYSCFRRPGRFEPGSASGPPIGLSACRKGIVSTHNGLCHGVPCEKFHELPQSRNSHGFPPSKRGIRVTRRLPDQGGTAGSRDKCGFRSACAWRCFGVRGLDDALEPAAAGPDRPLESRGRLHTPQSNDSYMREQRVSFRRGIWFA